LASRPAERPDAEPLPEEPLDVDFRVPLRRLALLVSEAPASDERARFDVDFADFLACFFVAFGASADRRRPPGRSSPVSSDIGSPTRAAAGYSPVTSVSHTLSERRRLREIVARGAVPPLRTAHRRSLMRRHPQRASEAREDGLRPHVTVRHDQSLQQPVALGVPR
jgi:hypothetical protein